MDIMRLFEDGAILRIRIVQVAEPVPPAKHRYAYSCFYGRPGGRAVLYANEGGQNEHGAGDNRHDDAGETAYRFKDIETLIADFLADVHREREAGA
jgi:hypothetical protein